MKIAHIADLHCCREHEEEALTSLRFLAEYIKKSPVSMVAVAGDTWDASMLNTEGSGFNRFIDAIRDIADLAPVAMIYGTPAHDTDGSLEVFRKITCRYGITILDPGQPYFLTELNGKGKIVQEIPGVSGKAIIFGIPEPRKKYLLAEASAGKDETEEAIRDAMHRLCYGIGAKRREYADIPCFVLYHGEVAGTVYQNNQTIERGTGIAITIDDLADIGADYYALGHIHKPQKVGNINAYYSGSIYPKNFGETHQASFKIVDVEASIDNDRLTSVDTVDFPHLRHLKIEISGDIEGNEICDSIKLPKNLNGFRVWIDYRFSKGNGAFVDPERQLAFLIGRGAAKNSRVTLCEIPIETVRAAAIADVTTPAKKFEVWAENSNAEFTRSHLKKIETLDAEITQGVAKAEGEWELVSLRLKGSIGIMKGIKKEEVVINFDNFDNGLIALTGANGKGKTTLIENCHPYPQLLTRKGKLQDHFFLKDSFREVIYRNRADGTMRKFLIQIDGQNKSGSCKYFIFTIPIDLSDTADPIYFTQKKDMWIPLNGVDGNLKPYEEALTATFGSIELFQRTAFITQRPTKNLPDITDATAGEKKSLFVALAGIDYLQGFSDAAAEKVKLESAKNHDAEIKMQVLHSAIGKKPEEETALKNYEAALTTKKAAIADVTKKGKIAKADLERLQTAWSAEQVRQSKENEAKAAVDDAGTEIKNLSLDIDTLTEAADNKQRYEKDVADYETQQKLIDAENMKKQAHTEASLKKQQDYTKVKSDYDENIKGVEAKRDALCDQRHEIELLVAAAESNIRLAVSNGETERNRLCQPLADRRAEVDRKMLTAKNHIELLERDATEIVDDCPTCGQRLPEDKLAELKVKREESVKKIDAEKAIIETLNAELADIAKKVCEAIEQAATDRDAKIATEKAEIQKQQDRLTEIDKRVEELGQQVSELAFDEPEKPEVKPFDDTALNAATTKQQRINITQTRAALTQAQEAAVRVDSLKKQVAEKTKLRLDKEAEYAKVKQNPDVGAKIKTDLDTATARHTELAEQYASVKSEIARTEATIEAAKKTLAEIAEKEKEYSVLSQNSQTAAIEGREWELIARAFGKDGIQALELDALAPGISETSNRILKSAYGDRFRIEIRTTRIGGAGKKTKQIEDFLIYVIDSEDGEAVLLDDKSGGEAVWIKRAIYDAFAVIRKRNTNFAFLTCFQDETDGALDSAAKTAYCQMLEAAHAESHLRHTIIITHSNEVKAMIDQKIDMETL